MVEDPRRAHNAVLFRQPITTLDEHLARGLRVEALADVVDGYAAADEDDEAVLDADDLVFGPPILQPPSLRDFYAFEGHVRTMWERRGGTVPEAWYRLPIFYFGNVSEIRGPGEAVWCPAASSELDYELEVAALIDTPVHDLDAAHGEEAIGGYLVFNDWSARDLQREETTVRLGPAKGKDFASSIGPWLVTPDELADARQGNGYDLAMTASVNGAELSRAAGRTRSSATATWWRAPAPTSGCARATCSAAARWGPAACSRSRTNRSAAGCSPATASPSLSNGWDR